MRSRTPESYVVAVIAAVIVAAVVLFSSFSSEAVYPLEKAAKGLSKVRAGIVGCFRGASASVENLRLRREIAALSVLRGDLERLESENARLRAVLEYADSEHGEWVPAAVLSAGGAAAVKNILRVDKGYLDGIAEDAVVVVPDGLVGLVTGVSPHTAEITLVSDSSVRVDCEVEVAGSSPAYGVLYGGGEDLLHIRHFRSAAEVPPRSRVLTSGRGGVFPRGIEIGVFNGVRKASPGILQEGEVIPCVDYRSLEDVFIRRAK